MGLSNIIQELKDEIEFIHNLPMELKCISHNLGYRFNFKESYGESYYCLTIDLNTSKYTDTEIDREIYITSSEYFEMIFRSIIDNIMVIHLKEK